MLLLHFPRLGCIYLSLPVRCLFLHFTKTLNLALTFLPFTGFLSKSVRLLGITALLELNDLLIKCLLASACLLFGNDRGSIAGLCLLLESLYSFLLLDKCFQFSFLLLLDVLQHLHALLLHQLFLSQSLNLTLFNLINDKGGALVDDYFSLLNLCVHLLQSFEPFDLHHDIKPSLLFDPVLFELFVLIQLLVADVQHTCLQNLLVHNLDVVIVFIQLVHGFGQ